MRPDCVVPTFSAWSTCTKSCGNGAQSRSRATVEPKNGGKACPHSAETRNCNKHVWAPDCVVPASSAWSTCTKSSCAGAQKRSLSVTTRHGGCPLPRKR